MLTKIILPVERQDFAYFSDEYAFNEKGKVLWLQRALFWVLEKLGCQQEKIGYKQVVIDTGDFVERLKRHRSDVWSRLPLEGGPTELLIGAEDFDELMSVPGVQCLIQFKAGYEVGHRTRRGDTHYRIMDLNVVIVPWMRGMVVMP